METFKRFISINRHQLSPDRLRIALHHIRGLKYSAILKKKIVEIEADLL
jgi:hypothetical protein